MVPHQYSDRTDYMKKLHQITSSSALLNLTVGSGTQGQRLNIAAGVKAVQLADNLKHCPLHLVHQSMAFKCDSVAALQHSVAP